MSIKFINFGCWNEGGCGPDTGLYHVTNTIRNREKRINFAVINGDNYYQIKQKDKSKTADKKSKSGKMVDQVQIKDGFDCLTNIPTNNFYLLMGNHDLEITNGSCETMEFEKNYRAAPKNYYLPTKLTMFKKVNPTTLIIMLDTNIYADENPQCLNTILENAPIPGLDKVEQINYLKQMQHDSILSELEGKQYTTIIVCGHHPLIGFKNQSAKFDEEKGKMKIKGGIDTYDRELYDLLFDTIKPHGINFMYLCSDIHNYQKGFIDIEKNGKTMKINQFIVGTGGAHLDDDYNNKYSENFKATTDITTLPENMTALHQIDENMSVRYTVEKHYSAYGYSVITVANTGRIEYENVQVRTTEMPVSYIDYVFNPPRKIKTFSQELTKKIKPLFAPKSTNDIFKHQQYQTRKNSKPLLRQQTMMPFKRRTYTLKK